jgi:hypothetical protein
MYIYATKGSQQALHWKHGKEFISTPSSSFTQLLLHYTRGKKNLHKQNS